MKRPDPPAPETDPRFPSGRWVGFFLMPHTKAQRHPTELHLTFATGVMSGEGRDKVGRFTIRGRYDTADGKCHWTKHYQGKHDVFYEGYNEGKGIWGLWNIPNQLGVTWRGGFHIWPEGMADPTGSTLHEEADPPLLVEGAEAIAAPLAPGIPIG